MSNLSETRAAYGVSPQDLEVLIAQGEQYYRIGEDIRQRRGFRVLQNLLALADPRVNHVLGLEEIPSAFNFENEWLASTGEYPFESTIQGRDGKLIEVMGVRVQDNVVDRKEQAGSAGIICPVGGGTRVTFVPGSLENDGTWHIGNRGTSAQHMLDEGRALAAAMVPKNLGLNFRDHLVGVLERMDRQDLIPQAQKIMIGGGAKADILVALPSNVEDAEKIELSAKSLFQLGYILGKKGAIGPFLDRLAGDVNTTSTWAGRPIIEWIADGYVQFLIDRAKETGETVDIQLARAVVSGKLVGGLEARADATGLGVWESLRAYAEQRQIDLTGKTAYFRGCGSAAREAIVKASEAGVKVTAISTRHGLIIKEEGFTPDDARALYQVSVEQKGSIADWADQHGVQVYARPTAKSDNARAEEMEQIVWRYWQEAKPDIIFESATQMTLNRNSAQYVPEGAIVVEGANGVTTPGAVDILKSRGVKWIPGVMANAGGVFVSWFEWAQAVLGVYFKSDLVQDEVANLMSQNMKATLNLIDTAAEYGLDLTLEDAYYALATARGLSARQQVIQAVTAV